MSGCFAIIFNELELNLCKLEIRNKNKNVRKSHAYFHCFCNNNSNVKVFCNNIVDFYTGAYNNNLKLFNDIMFPSSDCIVEKETMI